MTEHNVLDAVLDNAQNPHQPLVIIVDSAVFSGLPVFKEALRRALRRPGPVLLVTTLHRPGPLLPSNYVATVEPKLVDLTGSIPGSSTIDDSVEPQKDILSACSSESEVFIDAVELIADDRSPRYAIQLIRSLLSKLPKPPSRLVLLLPHTSALLPSLIPPSLSPTLTLLHLIHPGVVSDLSSRYLTEVASSPAFWQILESARERGTSEDLALDDDSEVQVIGDWVTAGIKGGVVQMLVRKATGGTKGISRALAGLLPVSSGSTMEVKPVSDLVEVNPVSAPSSQWAPATPDGAQAPTNLPFNLSLTDEQKRRRGEVPIPYAHEGEGVGIEFGDEEDEDDEEI